MILVTTEHVPGRQVAAARGLVRGSTVRARSIFRDFTAFLRNLFGGEVIEYTKVVAESREQALDRMVEQAVTLGADAVVNIRFTSSTVVAGAAEIVAYGTAVVFAPE
ncbi:MAG TPA: YbjQ family protein [Planctomycetota bacterium]